MSVVIGVFFALLFAATCAVVMYFIEKKGWL